MADTSYSSCPVGIMDRLWFHRTILFSEPLSSLVLYGCKKDLGQQPPPNSDTVLSCLPPTSSSSMSLLPPPDTATSQKMAGSTLATHSFSSSDQSNSSMDDLNNDELENQSIDRPTRANLIGTPARSHCSSPLSSSTHKRPGNRKHSTKAKKLHKSMSCRSFQELEIEEVKGFVDLGFIFKKEHLNSRLMRLLPGLHRLGLCPNTTTTESKTITVTKDEAEIDPKEEEEDRDIVRPYLSEAWLIRRPDSPLLNMRLPRAYAATDMKRHLRFWARTVASVIQQAS